MVGMAGNGDDRALEVSRPAHRLSFPTTSAAAVLVDLGDDGYPGGAVSRGHQGRGRPTYPASRLPMKTAHHLGPA